VDFSYFNATEAAIYLGVEIEDLRSAVRHRRGPAYVKPTPRKILFSSADLDAWRASWKRVEPDESHAPAWLHN
jgi:hypothetical protein